MLTQLVDLIMKIDNYHTKWSNPSSKLNTKHQKSVLGQFIR
jgi:hypothetical protein